MRLTIHTLLGAVLLAASPIGLAGDDPYDWLQRMGAAMKQMSYQGTFVYIQGGSKVETMRLTHVVDDYGTRERLVSLSGAPREVVRHDGHVRWVSGPEHSVMADADASAPVFPELPIDDPLKAANFYDFKLESPERIAGHSGRRLSIIPRDEFRYGYSLWMEKHSGLLLQWIVSDAEGEVLAQLMFTELKMGSQVNRSELGPKPGFGKKPERLSAAPVSHTSGIKPSWAPEKLPPGFKLASQRRQVQEGVTLEHLIYSDGIAAVSVYVEVTGQKAGLDSGLSRLGTTHAYSRNEDGVVITVVGDVPSQTVELIGASVAPAGDSSRMAKGDNK